MAQCKQTAQEFIQDAFSPMVAVLCSHDAELVCQKNHLSFVELIQPFCRLSAEAHIRDPGNIPHAVHNLHISVRDMNTNPPQSTLARKLMNEAVSNSYPATLDAQRNDVLSVGSYDLQLSASTPWYEAYRECFFQVACPSDHEFIKHFLACIFVVSSSHTDPMEQFARLTQQQHLQQHQHPHKLPKWFCPNVLRYYVIIHDVVEEEAAKSEAVYQSMKSTYGMNNCHLLNINSRSPNAPDNVKNELGTMPDPWSQYVSKKPDFTELADLDTGQSSIPTDTGAFPGHVTEGGPSITEDVMVESGVEVTEDNEIQTQSSIIIDHPLADHPENLSSTSTPSAAENDFFSGGSQDNHLLARDNQNNAILNSPGDHGQYGACLSLSDHDRLRIFIHEFMIRGLLPWVERTLRTLSDQVTTRKGIHRSFFSATKKWFAGNKPTGQTTITEKTNVVYTPEAPEMQMRRLGDLAFMFQLYEIAYQTYHTAKRDFNNDHAWLHYAGALEMACMSVFMQGSSSQRQYPNHYMEAAVSTYLSSCNAPHFATRATLLSTEALKTRGMYTDAAMQLIKMTSERSRGTALGAASVFGKIVEEDSDLRSALLLEQAAHCFIKMKVPMVRKYAFHMILAGHRFSKSGQRRQALRAYAQALQVYKGKNWTLAEDHINFTIGRQSFNLKHLENATAAFKHLLSIGSRQSTAQQNAFLREYLFVYKQQLSQSSSDDSPCSELPQLPLPVVDGNETKILCAYPVGSAGSNLESTTSINFESDETDNAIWQKLEELVVVDCKQYGSRLSTQAFTNSTNNSASPIAVVGEPISLEVVLVNPLKVSLILTDVMLLWRFLPTESNVVNETDHERQPPHMVTNEVETIKNTVASELIDTNALPEVVLNSNESRKVLMSLLPRHTGELHITGLAYNLAAGTAPQASGQNPSTGNPSLTSVISVRGKVNLEVQGPRLNNTKTEKAGRIYGPDRRLDLVIVSPMPKLEVYFSDFPQSLLSGETRQLRVEFRNTGSDTLSGIKVASTHPQFFTFGHASHIPSDFSNIYQTLANSSDADSEEYVIGEEDVKFVQQVALPGGCLEEGESVSMPVWIQGPSEAGSHIVSFVFFYDSADPMSKVKHRVLWHSARLTIQPSLGLRATVTRTGGCDNVSRSKVKPEKENTEIKNLVASLEVTNLSNVQDSCVSEFSLLQVSCASCRWHLHHLSTQRYSDIKIGSKESALMCFRASRSRKPAKKKEVVFTNVTFDQHQIDSSSTPCSDFYFRSQFRTKFEDLDAETTKPLSMPAVRHRRRQTGLASFASLDSALAAGLTLVVLWKAVLTDDDDGESHVICGQHHVTLDKLNTPVCWPVVKKLPLEQPPLQIVKEPVEASEPRPDQETTSQLLKYTLVHPREVSHDFTHRSLCHVNVEVQICNCSGADLHVEVTTDSNSSRHGTSSESHSAAGSGGGGQPTTVYQSYPSAPFSWSGQSTTKGLTLQPDATHALPLKACFCHPGVYNLSTLQVKAAPTSVMCGITVAMTNQKAESPSLIIVGPESGAGTMT